MAKKLQIIGTRGKSAYQYALDGGYTGSEADFKEKMAKEMDIQYDYDDLNDKILAIAIKQKASGEIIRVEDSAYGPILNLKLEGHSEQDVFTGKQLFDVESIKDPSRWTNTSDGGNAYTTISLPAGTYTFSVKENYLYKGNSEIAGEFTNAFKLGIQTSGPAKASECEYVIGDYEKDLSDLSNNVVLTIGESEKFYICIYHMALGVSYASSYIFDKYVVGIMLNEGEEALPFEKYTGGVQTPSLDLKSEIKSYGDNGAIKTKSVGKNLFDLEYFLDTNNYIKTANDYYCELKVTDLLPNTEYILSAKENNSTVYNLVIQLTNTNYDKSKLHGYGAYGVWCTLSTNSDGILTVYISHRCLKQYLSDNINKMFNDIPEIQLEQGNTRTDYEPYAEYTLSTPYVLRSIGDIKDYVDYKSGKLVQKIGHITFDGSDDEDWGIETIFGGVQHTILLDDADESYNESNLLCTHATAGSFDDIVVSHTIYGIASYHWTSAGRSLFFNNEFQTKEEWINFLRSNPVEVIYELAEPKIIDLTPDEMAQFRDFHSFQSHTTVSNDAGIQQEIEYIVDPEIYIDNLITSLSEV